jgi:hypothetical protein
LIKRLLAYDLELDIAGITNVVELTIEVSYVLLKGSEKLIA